MSPGNRGKDQATRRLYLDTSAYLCILLGEEGAQELLDETASQELLSSSLLILEAYRNLVRLTRLGELSPPEFATCLQQLENDCEVLVLRDLTLDLCRTREMPTVSTPRTLDLAHLRTALWFHHQAPLTRFISLDAIQNQAAGEMGLPLERHGP